VRLVDWALVYAIVGVSCAVVLGRREAAPARADLLLAGLLWPIYVPVLVAGARPSSPAPTDEHARLVRAVLAVNDPLIVPLLPSRAHLDALASRLGALGERVRSLDDAIADERAFASGPHGDAARDGLARLTALRDRAAAEHAALSGLIARLRVQITVLGFTGSADASDVRDLVAELAARVEGVDAALGALADDRAPKS
jgi:hypothetical protein